ncbi:MAG: Dyp-type peroxidase [Actinomycetota bacterium]|nr:Dyp-type peroxidase [Actinomycetota bacterium]
MAAFAQGGILNRPPEHMLVAALAFVDDRAPARSGETLGLLQELIHHELRSDLDEQSAQTPKEQVSPETGELGFEDGYDRGFLTITFGIAASGFDALGVAADQRPADLIEIPWDLLGDTPAKRESGDLVLQICGDDPYVVEHVLRRVEEELGDRLAIIWTQAGVQRYTTRRGRPNRREARALNGFLDGTSNLRPRDNSDDADLVFVDPERVHDYPKLPQPGQQPGYPGTGPTFPGDLRPPPDHEPEWCRGGTYMVVRSSALRIGPWDDQTLGAQEQAIGRFKLSGASLDLADEPSQLNVEPAFVANQSDARVPFDSHVRKVNPRRPEDAPRRIFRRGFPLLDSTLDGVRRGLVFICFGRTLSTQFEFIERAWTTNPNFPQQNAGVDRLRQFEDVICGGYYFVPAIAHRRQPWSWVLPATA